MWLAVMWLAAYLAAGVALAERIRRQDKESIAEFWGTDWFGNTLVICVWPVPVLMGFVRGLRKSQLKK